MVDEVLVIDSGSTDQTEQICLEKGARFIHHDWAGYSDQKNWANQQAKGKYILSLDADEALSKELRDSLSRLKENGLTGVYGCNRKTNYCGTWINHCGWYPDRKIRLFPCEGSQWEGSIHEELHWPQGLVAQWLEGDLLHYSYYTEKEHLDRIEKYARLKAKNLKKRGKKAGLLKGYASAFARFVRMYFALLGFLDGKAGYKVCRHSAWAAFLKYKYLKELNQQVPS